MINTEVSKTEQQSSTINTYIYKVLLYVAHKFLELSYVSNEFIYTRKNQREFREAISDNVVFVDDAILEIHGKDAEGKLIECREMGFKLALVANLSSNESIIRLLRYKFQYPDLKFDAVLSKENFRMIPYDSSNVSPEKAQKDEMMNAFDELPWIDFDVKPTILKGWPKEYNNKKYYINAFNHTGDCVLIPWMLAEKGYYLSDSSFPITIRDFFLNFGVTNQNKIKFVAVKQRILPVKFEGAVDLNSWQPSIDVAAE